MKVTSRAVRRFATLGDSVTAGTAGDEWSLWPQLVTEWLATHSPGVRHFNFAIDGAMSGEVLRDQVPLALESRPDLVIVICGANDVLHYPRPDVEAAGDNLAACLGRLAEEILPARIATATYPDFVRFLPWRPKSKARVASGLARLNEAIRLVAEDHGTLCVDLAAWSRRYSDEAYDADGIHPSQVGHRRIAIAMTLALSSRLELPDAHSYWEASER